MGLRRMTQAEQDERSAIIGIPNPKQVTEMGIYHFPSPAYTMLWYVPDEDVLDDIHSV